MERWIKILERKKINLWPCKERIDRDVWFTIPGECDILLTLSRVNLRHGHAEYREGGLTQEWRVIWNFSQPGGQIWKFSPPGCPQLPEIQNTLVPSYEGSRSQAHVASAGNYDSIRENILWNCVLKNEDHHFLSAWSSAKTKSCAKPDEQHK